MIGAGPAGIVSAVTLARQGVPVVLIDKAVFPRKKPCGDNISGNTIRIAQRLFPSILHDLGAHLLPIWGVRCYAPNHHHLDIDFLPLERDTAQPSCYTIPRHIFDNYLLDQARGEANLRVVEGFGVQGLEWGAGGWIISGSEAQAPLEAAALIVASGSNSAIPQMLTGRSRRKRHLAIGVRAFYTGVAPIERADFCELFIDPRLMPGGLYLTPFRDGSMNVNATIRADVARRQGLNLPKITGEVLRTHPLLKDRFAEARCVDSFAGSQLRLGTVKGPLSGDGFLLAGDAAGLIDLLSANGLPQAMVSATLAAEKMAEAWMCRDLSAAALAAYDRQVYQRIDAYLKLSRLVDPFIGFVPAQKGAIYLMNTLARRFDKNRELRNLLYDQHAGRTLIKPSFYYRLFFGLKNTDALKV